MNIFRRFVNFFSQASSNRDPAAGIGLFKKTSLVIINYCTVLILVIFIVYEYSYDVESGIQFSHRYCKSIDVFQTCTRNQRWLPCMHQALLRTPMPIPTGIPKIESRPAGADARSQRKDIDDHNIAIDLPEDCAVELLSSWLSLPDVARLDSAVCNRAKRVSFLSFLSSPDGYSLVSHPKTGPYAKADVAFLGATIFSGLMRGI